jgi:methionyl-tRNA formyltransferase
MKIDVVISDRSHPQWPVISDWAVERMAHRIRILDTLTNATGGDCLVMVACHEIATQATRSRYGRCFVTHASDLPEGRGWSPAIWDIVRGKGRIVLSLIEAADPVDTGAVFRKFHAPVKPTDLHGDINKTLSMLIVSALDFILQNPDARPEPQRGEPTSYRRRTPDDSRLDPHQSIASQFDLLRVCDPGRFPAFFELFGERFELIVRKSSKVPPS